MPNELTGRIAMAAKSEIPLAWSALRDSSEFGPDFLTKKVESVKTSLFNEQISTSTEEALDNRVVDYAGKMVALSLINPSLDYWSKQPVSIGATGRNENKGYGDRSAMLLKIRASLTADVAKLFPEVQALLPARRGPRPDFVRVQPGIGLTPDPFVIEPPFAS